jgi:hypothetical protein
LCVRACARDCDILTRARTAVPNEALIEKTKQGQCVVLTCAHACVYTPLHCLCACVCARFLNPLPPDAEIELIEQQLAESATQGDAVQVSGGGGRECVCACACVQACHDSLACAQLLPLRRLTMKREGPTMPVRVSVLCHALLVCVLCTVFTVVHGTDAYDREASHPRS